MVTELKNKISLTKTIIDESYDPLQCKEYSMNVQIGKDDIIVAVKEIAKNKFIAMEQFQFVHNFNFALIDSLLEEVIGMSKLIPHKYRSVNCLFVSHLSTIVPNSLFDEDRKKAFLKFNTDLQGDELVVVNDIKNLNAKNIFALPFSVKSKVDFLFNNANYIHFSTVLIENLLLNNKNQNTKKVFIHVQNSHFELIVIESNNLLFYNSFNYQTPEDLIYYLLFAFEQLKLNPEKNELYLLGDIEKNDAIYLLINKYVRTIKFAERNDGSDYSYQLQNLSKHIHFTLLNA